MLRGDYQSFVYLIPSVGFPRAHNPLDVGHPVSLTISPPLFFWQFHLEGQLHKVPDSDHLPPSRKSCERSLALWQTLSSDA